MSRKPETGTAPTGAGRVRAYLMFTVLLIAAWVLWSGMFKPLLLALGGVSCLLVLYLAQRMRLFEHDVFSLRFTGRLLRFWGWLGREIVRSSLDVTRVVLSPKLPISPTVYDRVLSVNMFGTKTVLLISVIAFLAGRPDFLDLALAYALINFIGVLAVLEFFKSRAARRAQEEAERRST